MRLRNKQWTKEYIEQNQQHFINSQDDVKNFAKDSHLHIEIGCGKGKFITELKYKNPTIKYIAIEREATVIGVALKKALVYFDNKLENLKFWNGNAKQLGEYFEKSSVDKIYLNFSDPWPKKRHSKNRLTHINFLNIYLDILRAGGVIEIKTDNENLYNFTLEEITKSKFTLVYKTTNLYQDIENNLENIATEYEQKFVEQNKNIYKICLVKN
ncbi:tRNA (guanosine(46)-N7)-methyltransferase TrmB [Spiroplasma endosymbiont of Crioceris asparagi]|uniref:tRNA (guanosine(46)-N7)-methyltransferase TrmB n=1 Tax=Spiroplasma endosymbiont of Crioceris asparagi TaxID=3066286 RepID=UPI0030CB7F34